MHLHVHSFVRSLCLHSQLSFTPCFTLRYMHLHAQVFVRSLCLHSELTFTLTRNMFHITLYAPVCSRLRSITVLAQCTNIHPHTKDVPHCAICACIFTASFDHCACALVTSSCLSWDARMLTASLAHCVCTVS